MEIKAVDVAKLRKMTGAGMMDCKKALVERPRNFRRLCHRKDQCRPHKGHPRMPRV